MLPVWLQTCRARGYPWTVRCCVLFSCTGSSELLKRSFSATVLLIVGKKPHLGGKKENVTQKYQMTLKGHPRSKCGPREAYGVTVECGSKHLALETCTMAAEFHLLTGERFMRLPNRQHPGMPKAVFGVGSGCCLQPSFSQQCAGPRRCKPVWLSGAASASQPSQGP